MTGRCDIEPCLTVRVSRHPDGSLATVVTFPTGEEIHANAHEPDLGFDEVGNVLHDVAHTLLACHLGLRSPVLERVADLRPLSQYHVDLEEAATFALQAWCDEIQGRDPLAAIGNALASLHKARVERYREAIASQHRSRRRGISTDARRFVAGIEDPDDAYDMAVDFDEEDRLDPVIGDRTA